jgi:hypothetical protein
VTPSASISNERASYLGRYVQVTTLKMEASYFSETLVHIYDAARHQIAEGRHLNTSMRTSNSMQMASLRLFNTVISVTYCIVVLINAFMIVMVCVWGREVGMACYNSDPGSKL